MRKLNGLACRFEKGLLLILLVAMVFLGFLQILSRFVLKSPIVWSEGLLMYMFVWSSFIGASLAVAESVHFEVEVFMTLLPENVQKWTACFVQFLIMAFAVFVVLKGSYLCFVNQRQMMPLLPFSMTWPYMALPFSGVFMTIHTLGNMTSILKGDR